MRREEASKPPTLSDKEVYQAAKLLIDQYGVNRVDFRIALLRQKLGDDRN